MLRFIAIALFIQAASVARADSVPNRKFQFVFDYISALSATESIRADAENDLRSIKAPQQRFSSCVHSSQLQMHAMASAANPMATYKLDGNASGAPGLLVKYLVTRGEMFSSLRTMCQTMLQGSKPNVDYGKVAASIPKLRADMEDLDKSLLPMSVMVFDALISPIPDKAGHVSRLIVTKQERDRLAHQISISFKRLDAKDANYTVSAAALLWDYLERKGYRCADEST